MNSLLKVFIPILLLSSFATQQESTGGLIFYPGTWQEAREKAGREHKLIFLDISTSWCGWCKKMRQTTYADKKVGAYFNDAFICMELDGESGDGKRLVQKFGATGFPAIYLIDKNENPLLSSEGYHPPEDLMHLVKSVVKPEN